MFTLTLVLLAATPDSGAATELAVVVTSERRVSAELAQGVVRRVAAALTAERVDQVDASTAAQRFAAVEGLGDPKHCQGAPACVARFAAALGARGVVASVDVGKLGKNLTVQLEAVAHDGSVLVSSALTVPATKLNAMAGPLSAFALSVAQALAARAEPPKEPPSDAPRAVALQPTPTPPPPEVRLAAPAKSSRLPWVLGGAAVVAAAASVVAGVLAANDRASWDRALVPEDQRFGTTLSPSEANALAARINTESSISLGAGIGAGALGVGALISALAQ